MRRFYVFAVLVLALAAFGCSKEKYGAGVDSGAPLVTVKDVMMKPEFQGKDVTLEGEIATQCQSSGCWFVLRDATGQIFVDFARNNFSVPARLGKIARVSGTASLSPDGYMVVARGVELR